VNLWNALLLIWVVTGLGYLSLALLLSRPMGRYAGYLGPLAVILLSAICGPITILLWRLPPKGELEWWRD